MVSCESYTADDGGGDGGDEIIPMWGRAAPSCSPGCQSQQQSMISWGFDTDDDGSGGGDTGGVAYDDDLIEEMASSQLLSRLPHSVTI